MADAMVSSGMKDAGYTYINIDDCWHGNRDAQGFIQPDQMRFPSGIKALADYVHSKGLKLGIYSDGGARTCAGRPGSRGYEFPDAYIYAQWGIDYLKYDWCDTEGLAGPPVYKTMAAALKKAGRPIVLSVCEWGSNKPWEWAPELGQLWRTTGDIFNCFECISANGIGVIHIIDRQEGLRKYAKPGQWNDPDMLEIGNGALTPGEDRLHFTMWAMLAAPLIAGNDLRTMNKETVEVLTNKDVIAINQDRLGIEGFKVSAKDELEVWAKPLAGGDWAIVFLNRSKGMRKVNFDWSNQKIYDDLNKLDAEFAKNTYTLKNLWDKKDKGKATTKKAFIAEVPSHDIIGLRLRRK
jgi:alpha-galactosidase